jgi:ribosomal protein S18 acetylase RimI-like enzyme
VSEPVPGAGQEVELTIAEATKVDDELVTAFERLTPQLSRSNPPPSAQALGEIVASPATVLFVARLGDLIVGSLTLAQFRIPTGLRAWIEDVVVDESARGRGVGEALNKAALARALADGCRTVDLTSRPSREAANRLYQRLGFKERETNVYRYDLGG